MVWKPQSCAVLASGKRERRLRWIPGWFEANDLEGATQALLRVAVSPEDWNRYGRAGRAHIEREYSLSTQAARLEAIYERCVEG